MGQNETVQLSARFCFDFVLPLGVNTEVDPAQCQAAVNLASPGRVGFLDGLLVVGQMRFACVGTDERWLEDRSGPLGTACRPIMHVVAIFAQCLDLRYRSMDQVHTK